ncbi:MAG: DUF805 domain-containing protein [Lachnospiraceae bacterium]|nr:DUF805 domain-containing protein [Lachnospiraceae bacterium]
MEKKDVNFFSAQIKLWARIFDYKGTSTRKEYWFPFILHALIGLVAFINLLSSGLFVIFMKDWNFRTFATVGHYIGLILGVILLAYLALSTIPWIALTVRRLRDAGKSGWWVLLLLVFGIGQIIILFLCSLGSAIAGAFAFNAGNNLPEGIYGPPEMFDPDYNINGDVYGPPPFDPDINVPDPVYGPPGFEEDNNDPFNSEDNIQPTLYGPPDMFDEGDYNFDPDANLNEDVYGPPEWFDE